MVNESLFLCIRKVFDLLLEIVFSIIQSDRMNLIVYKPLEYRNFMC